MITNETKHRAWHGRVKIADNFLKRFKGLMFERGIDYALIFVLPVETRANASIHMFFMLEDIDVIWLDSSKRVADFKNAKRMRIYVPRKPAKYVIEGPTGIIGALKVEVGDLITWSTDPEGRKTVTVKTPSGNRLSFGRNGRPVMVENVKSVSDSAERAGKIRYNKKGKEGDDSGLFSGV